MNGKKSADIPHTTVHIFYVVELYPPDFFLFFHRGIGTVPTSALREKYLLCSDLTPPAMIDTWDVDLR